MSKPAPPPSYDVLLHATLTTRIGPSGRWFIAGHHESRPRARLQFQELCQEFPDPRVILVLAVVAYDTETGRFHDRIIDARGLAPLIDRKTIEPLTPLAKKAIMDAHAWRTQAPKPTAAPKGMGLGWWLVGGGAALALAALSLLR